MRDQRLSNPVPFGKYTLLERIGSGGMAEIFRAKMYGAHGFEKEVAIKRILPNLTDDSEFIEMFIDEAKLMVGMMHNNIVQVFDLGEIEGQYFIGMEFIHGKDLLDVLARCAEQRLKLPLKLALLVLMEALKGLDYAHKATDPYGRPLNLIHRDVSPSNVLISYRGAVKISDFGVAKAATQRTQTQVGTLKGKVGYMSPEQVRGDRIDHRSDIFSAGIILYEVLNMRRLFSGGSDLDIMLRVRDVDVGKELSRGINLPPDLRQIVERALARDPNDRYQTGQELHDDLMDFMFRNRIRVSNNDLTDFMARLFKKEIEQDRERMRARQLASSQINNSGSRRSRTGLTKRRELQPLRYRNSHGTEYGPMDEGKLIELIAASNSSENDWVARGSGPWVRIHDEPDLYQKVQQLRAQSQDASVARPPSNAELRIRQAAESNLFAFDPAHDSAESSGEHAAAQVGGANPSIPDSQPLNIPTQTGQTIHGIFGDCESTPFALLLFQLWNRRATGPLSISHSATKKTITLKMGNPTEVSSNLDSELLGNFLVREGIVTETQLSRALKRAKRFGGRLGDALVADRVILSHVLYQYLFRQAKLKILEVFTCIGDNFRQKLEIWSRNPATAQRQVE